MISLFNIHGAPPHKKKEILYILFVGIFVIVETKSKDRNLSA